MAVTKPQNKSGSDGTLILGDIPTSHDHIYALNVVCMPGSISSPSLPLLLCYCHSYLLLLQILIVFMLVHLPTS